MDTYRPKYYIVDWVVKAVHHIVHLARQFLAPVAVRGGPSAPSSWTELLQLMPSSYLRLVITLEMSIGQGKLPEESDFPPTLRGSAEISVSIPDMGKFLQARPERRERDQEAEKEQARVTEITDEAPNLTYDFDIAAAMDFMGDDVSFQTPQPGQGVSFGTPQPNQDGAPFEAPRAGRDDFGPVNMAADGPFPSAAENTAPDFDAVFGGYQAGDDFDEWANRVLGIEAIPF